MSNEKDIVIQTSYDEVPYKSFPIPQSHPDHLATLGLLFGLAPAPVTKCRVLELGCAGGGNLIPMAFYLPQSNFVGVDLSRRQIESDYKIIQDLELQNISLKHADIMDVERSWGTFDYIICHGVYSWVPRKVQEKILEICSSNLAPQGIAYVSYNTYPGWHMREIIRHMMLYQANMFSEADDRIKQARALIDFIASSVPAKNNYYGMLLRQELDLIQNVSDSYLYHDHMEDINEPVYFYQFIERADKHGLKYLADSNFSTMLTSLLPRKVTDTLQRISPNIITDEQYMDFIRNRHFRHTLLCHKGHKLKRNLNSKDLSGFLVSSNVKPVNRSFRLQAGREQTFKIINGPNIKTDSPSIKAMLTVLSRHWPKALDQKTLFEEAGSYLDESAESSIMEEEKEQKKFTDGLLHCFSSNAIELRTWQAEFVSKVTKKPQVSKLAFYQSKNKQLIVNPYHRVFKLDTFAQRLTGLLDGTRDRVALLHILKGMAEDGTLVVRQDTGKRVQDAGKVENALKKAINRRLSKLAKAALLVA